MGNQKKKDKSREKKPTPPRLQSEDDFPTLGTKRNDTNTITNVTSITSNKNHGKGSNVPKAVSTTQHKPPVTYDPNAPPPPPPITCLSSAAWLKTTSIDAITIESAVHTKSEIPPSSNWYVHATKSAKLPIQVEKRRHKMVTVVRNITGEASELLSCLKLALGTGGKLIDGTDGDDDGSYAEVEIQGDHVKRIAKFLCAEHSRLLLGGEKGVLKGVCKAELASHIGSTAKNKQPGGGSGGGSGKSIAKLDEKAALLKQKGGGKRR